MIEHVVKTELTRTNELHLDKVTKTNDANITTVVQLFVKLNIFLDVVNVGPG